MNLVARVGLALTVVVWGSGPALGRDFGVEMTSRDGTQLTGTLSVPDGPGRHPAALLIGGFGPHNRDGRFQSSMYRLWSDGLVARGIVTLRYDKRGTGSSGGKPFAWLDPLRLQEDIVAAAQTLAARPEVRGGRLTLVGHSQGGDLALAVAPRLRFVTRIVTLAAPGRPLGDYSRSGLDLVRTIVGPTAAAALARADPLADAARVRQPVLLVQGLADRVVDPSDAERLLSARRRAGRPTRILRAPLLGHTMVDDAGLVPRGLLNRVADFIG